MRQPTCGPCRRTFASTAALQWHRAHEHEQCPDCGAGFEAEPTAVVAHRVARHGHKETQDEMAALGAAVHLGHYCALLLTLFLFFVTVVTLSSVRPVGQRTPRNRPHSPAHSFYPLCHLPTSLGAPFPLFPSLDTPSPVARPSNYHTVYRAAQSTLAGGVASEARGGEGCVQVWVLLFAHTPKTDRVHPTERLVAEFAAQNADKTTLKRPAPTEAPPSKRPRDSRRCEMFLAGACARGRACPLAHTPLSLYEELAAPQRLVELNVVLDMLKKLVVEGLGESLTV